MQAEFPAWSLVIEKIVSLEELEKHWSIYDVMKTHEVLQLKADSIQEKVKKQRGNSKRTVN